MHIAQIICAHAVNIFRVHVKIVEHDTVSLLKQYTIPYIGLHGIGTTILYLQFTNCNRTIRMNIYIIMPYILR